jgi:hypothetical protein
MKKIAFIALSLTALITSAQTTSQNTESNVHLRQELTKLRQTFFEAQKQGNRSVLDQLLAPDFYFVHSTGVLTNRKEFIDRTVEQAGRQRDIEFLEQELYIYGEHTAVWLTRSVTRTNDGTEINFRATDVLAKNGKQWQWVAVNSTKLSTRPKPVPVSADTIKSYLGEYQINANKKFIVTEEKGTLIGQSAGIRQRELIPIAATEFVWFSPDSNIDMRVVFIRDGGSRVNHAILKSEGKEVWRAKKIE